MAFFSRDAFLQVNHLLGKLRAFECFTTQRFAGKELVDVEGKFFNIKASLSTELTVVTAQVKFNAQPERQLSIRFLLHGQSGNQC